jgi:hypothetical protein
MNNKRLYGLLEQQMLLELLLYFTHLGLTTKRQTGLVLPN